MPLECRRRTARAKGRILDTESIPWRRRQGVRRAAPYRGRWKIFTRAGGRAGTLETLPHSSGGCAHPSEPPAAVSLFIESTVSGIEASLENAPIAPASIARPATEVSRLAVN